VKIPREQNRREQSRRLTAPSKNPEVHGLALKGREGGRRTQYAAQLDTAQTPKGRATPREAR